MELGQARFRPRGKTEEEKVFYFVGIGIRIRTK
jgi:hypothetical protein